MFVLLVIIVSVCFAAAGSAILRIAGYGRGGPENLIYGWAICAGLTACIFLAGGLIGFFNSTFALIWMAILFLLLIIFWKELYGSKDFIIELYNIRRGIPGNWKLFFLAAIIVYLAVSFIGAIAPPSHTDVLNYHFALIKQYILNGAINFNPTFLHAAIPFNAEMLSSFITLLDGFRGGQLIQFAAGLLLILSVYFVGRSISDNRLGAIGIIVFMSIMFIPPIFSEGKSDQLLALFSFLSLYSFAKASSDSDTAELYLAAVLAGLACGTKVFGAGVPLAGFILVIAFKLSGRNKILARDIVAAVVVSAAVALPWYIRSWILTGNPLHPFFTEIFKDRYWDPVLEFALEERRGYYIEPGLREFLLSPLRLTFWPDLYKARIGPLFLAAVPLAIFFRPKNRIIRFFGWTSLVYFIPWFLFLQDVRFLLPVLPGLSLFCASVLVEIIDRGRTIRNIILAVLFINLMTVLIINIKNQYQKFPAAFGFESESEFYRDYMVVDKYDLSSGRYVKAFPEYGFLMKVKQTVEKGCPIGIICYFEPIYYFWLDNPVYLLVPFHQNAFDYKTIKDKEDLESELKRFGIKYILSDTGDDLTVPDGELLHRNPEYKSTLNGMNIMLDYLNNDCEKLLSEGKWRCFKVEVDD